VNLVLFVFYSVIIFFENLKVSKNLQKIKWKFKW